MKVSRSRSGAVSHDLVRSRSRAGRMNFAKTVAGWFAASNVPGRFDPGFRDWATSGALFQDSAGTTPVTALEQPVGLRLDRSRNGARGNELVPMPLDLSSGAWATVGALSAITANSFTNASGAGAGRTLAVLVTNKTYEILVDYTKSDNTTGFLVQAGVGNANTVSVTAASGVYPLRVTATANTLYLRLAGNATVTINSISVKEIPGSHRIQPTTTARPILSGWKNRLSASDNLAAAAWLKRGVVAVSTVAGPDGQPASGTRLTGLAGPSVSDVYQILSTVNAFPPNAAHVPSLSVRRSTTAGTLRVNNAQNASNGSWEINLALLGSDWEIIAPGHPALTVVTPWVATAIGISGMQISAPVGSPVTVDLWGLQLVAGATAGRYQRTGLSPQTGDYDAVGFPIGLRYDGSDDCMYTAAPIDYSLTDKVTVIYPAQKAQSAVAALLMEHGPNVGATVGSFAIYSGDVNATGPYWGGAARAAGGVVGFASSATFPAPVSSVVSLLMDASVPSAKLRVNGIQEATVAPTGGGNFTSQVSYEGARNNASLRFNGMVLGEFEWGDTTALSADRLALVEAQFAKLLLEA